MVKRKLAISKSPTKKTGKFTNVKLQKILENVQTESFMKFNVEDVSSKKSPSTELKTSASTKSIKKLSKAKGVSKKDKMLFKKQRLLQKFESSVADFKKGMSRKDRMKFSRENTKLNKNEAVSEAQIIEETDTIAKVIKKTEQLDLTEMLKEAPPQETKKTKKLNLTGLLKENSKETKKARQLSVTDLLKETSKETQKTKKLKFKEILETAKKATKTASVFKKSKNNSKKNRQKNFSNGIKAYKKQMKKEEFTENPLKAISDRVNAYVRKETAV